MNETHLWQLAAFLVVALLLCRLAAYLTEQPKEEEPAPLAPTATDHYIRELAEARRAKALRAAQRSLDEGAARG